MLTYAISVIGVDSISEFSEKSILVITAVVHIHCESKKNCTLFISNITLSNVDRF